MLQIRAQIVYRLALSVAVPVGLAGFSVACADDAQDAAGHAFFEAKIRPVLVQQCYKCHSASGKKSEGSLLLDSRDGIRKGGDRGPAVVPGKPKESLLLTALTHADSDLKMPPKKEQLPTEVIRDFEKWIEMGAPDPREQAAAGLSGPVDIETGRKFWSYRKPLAQPAPKVIDADWPRQKLDHFVLAKLEEAKLASTADASPAVLLRRLHFDLIGLPPSPAALEAFAKQVGADGLDVALAAEVDRLLATPQFGETWGRHWLDVARFAESSGKEANMSFPYAWRYRDYVIDAVNVDVPYERFLIEQIAGDLLPAKNDRERARLLIATGFLALGSKNLEEGDPLQFSADIIDEQIDTVTRSVLATSVACARCHDHKFDPFTMHDYYALAGIFGSTKTYFGTYVTPVNRVGGDPLVLPAGANAPILHTGVTAAHVDHLKKQLAALKKEQVEGMAKAMQALAKGEDSEKVFALRDALRIFWSSGGIEGQLEKVDSDGKPLPLAMGVLDAEKIQDARLLERGEVKKVGEPVRRDLPKLFEISNSFSFNGEQSGRLELASWLTHPEHPLTARVMVNRVWRHLFGAGLVSTVDNFGFSGERPSHPELLDDLAVQFVADGWSVKKLVRMIVLSRTYRQGSTYSTDSFKVDPDNRLLWRMSKRRLPAEAIRDAMLAATGELDHQRPVGSLVGKQIGDRPISLIGLDATLPSDLDGSLHRSVYLPVIRDRLPDVLDLFDFAEPSLVTGDRATTNVPVQALYLMNSPFVQARSKALAERLAKEAANVDQQVDRAFAICLGRSPDDTERKLAQEFLAEGDKQVLGAYCQALLAAAEFRNID
jgi:hypothetical protein